MKIVKPTKMTMVTTRYAFINDNPVVETLKWVVDSRKGQKIEGDKFGSWRMVSSVNFLGTLDTSSTGINLTLRDSVILVDSEEEFNMRVAKLDQ